MNLPKHKPTDLNGSQEGGRERLYGPGSWTGSNHHGWEGINAAKSRKVVPPEDLARKIVSRLEARLMVANGAIPLIDPEKGTQVQVDPRITNNLLGNLLRTTRQIRSLELRKSYTEKVAKLRKSFKEING